MKPLVLLFGLLCAATVLQSPTGQKLTSKHRTIIRGQERQVDAHTIKMLVVSKGIDTAKAQLRIIGDTAWIWDRREGGSSGAQLYRSAGLWMMYSMVDTARF